MFSLCITSCHPFWGVLNVLLPFTQRIIDFLPYYGLFSRDIHFLDNWWRLSLCILLTVEISAVCIFLLCSMTYYDITIGNKLPEAAVVTSQYITIGNDIARNIYCDITLSNDFAKCTSQCQWRFYEPLLLNITMSTYDIGVSPANSLTLYT